jgi:hypothetical protein
MLLTLSSTFVPKVSVPVVPGRQGQKVSSASSRPVKSQKLRGPVPPMHPSRQPRPSTLISGSQTEPQTSNSDDSTVSRERELKGTPSSVSTRPQKGVSCPVAISAVTPRSGGLAPKQKPHSRRTSSGSSPHRRNAGYGKKKVCCVHLGHSDCLTKPRIISSRTPIIQEPGYLFHRRVCRRSRSPSRDCPLCSVIR